MVVGSEPVQSQSTYCETPYTRLAEWISSAASTQPLSEELVRKILEEKANDPDLLTKETWLLNVASRRYTRGLLMRYRERDMTRNSGQPAGQTSELNHLLLEDAFAEHIQQKTTLR